MWRSRTTEVWRISCIESKGIGHYCAISFPRPRQPNTDLSFIRVAWVFLLVFHFTQHLFRVAVLHFLRCQLMHLAQLKNHKEELVCLHAFYGPKMNQACWKVATPPARRSRVSGGRCPLLASRAENVKARYGTETESPSEQRTDHVHSVMAVSHPVPLVRRSTEANVATTRTATTDAKEPLREICSLSRSRTTHWMSL